MGIHAIPLARRPVSPHSASASDWAGSSQPAMNKGDVLVTSSNDVTRIILTGGPCGGKTSALAHLKAHFEAQGVRIFRVSELATILIGGGAVPMKSANGRSTTCPSIAIERDSLCRDLYRFV